MNTTIRFATLVRKHGPLKQAVDCTQQEWEQAKTQRRFFTVYHAESFAIYSIDSKFLEALAGRLERKNAWGILLHEGALTVSIGDRSETADLVKHQA